MTTVSTGQIATGDLELASGTEVGEYQIEVAIGRGGFGTVYRAVHPLIGKLVAIKVLARKYSSDPEVVSRFVAEARAVNQIRHRNIIDIFAFGTIADGRHYYVMEYLDGEPFDQHLRRTGPMPLAEALPILRAIARALDAAHGKGIAHRDLKPENIFLAQDPDGGAYPKLLDFGIAKLLVPEEGVRHRTGTGVPLGTPYYMSPEQCRGRDVDHRTDVYSFGIVAYRTLTGALPFEAEDYIDVMFKQINDEAPPASSRNAALPPSVDAAIAWMMAKDRERRPATVLEGVLALEPGAHATPSIPPRPASKPRVEPAMATAATMTPDALAPTTISPPMPRRRVWPWLGGGLAIAGGAIAFAVTRGESAPPSPPPKIVVAPPPADAAVPPPSPPVDAAAASPQRTVAIGLMKMPAHTRTRVDGKELELPGVIVVPRSDVALVLHLTAAGFEPRALTVIPDRDQMLNDTLRAAPAPARPAGGPVDPHGIPTGDDIFHKGGK